MSPKRPIFHPTVLLFLFWPFLSVAKEGCPAPRPLPSDRINPRSIQAWLKMSGSKVRSIEDFICCLPTEYQKNFIVGHSSVAAQNGTPESPRILFFRDEKDNRLQVRQPTLILSVNGGGQHVSQGDSVEMAYFDPQKQQMEFFDLEFKEKTSKLSPANPTTCMSCHGDAGSVPMGGPKLIFEPFDHWPHFVGGSMDCSKEEDHLQNALSDRAVMAVKENPRFRCLDKTPLDGTGAVSPKERYPRLSDKTRSFDLHLLRYKALQRGKWLKSLQGYDQYKYALVGSQLCSGRFRLKEWIPKSVLEAKRKDLGISSKLVQAKKPEEEFLKLAGEEYDRVFKDRKVKAEIGKNPERLFRRGMNPNLSPFACEQKDREDFLSEKKQLQTLMAKSLNLSPSDIESVLSMDSRLRNRPSSFGLEPIERFFLETEGHNNFLAQSSMRPGEETEGSLPVPISLEKPESDLVNLFNKRQNRCGAGECFRDPSGDFYEPKEPGKICDQLRDLSINAFRNRESEKMSPAVFEKSRR